MASGFEKLAFEFLPWAETLEEAMGVVVVDVADDVEVGVDSWNDEPMGDGDFFRAVNVYFCPTYH